MKRKSYQAISSHQRLTEELALAKADLVTVVRDPVTYTQQLLGHDVWETPAAILRSIGNNRRTAVKSCHASGKTFTAAEAVLWWITRFEDGLAVTTAPTWNQVEKLLWGEICKAVATAKYKLPAPGLTSLYIDREKFNYAYGLSTNEGVRFQGVHGQVLIVMDEAPGVAPDIWEAIEGIRAGGDVRILALGNPVIASGPFYDAFGANRSGWSTFTISAFDTPNLRGITLDQLLKMPESDLDRNVRPYLVTRRWVKEKYYEWGPGHPLWDSRVLGNFPSQAEDALISLTWLEQAKIRQHPVDESVVDAGLDVAGPGEDETVLAVRCGPKLLSLESWTESDPRGKVLAALEPYKGRLRRLNVDSTGIGYGMARHLQDYKYPVRDVNVGTAARASDKYANLKAELYWGLRMRFQSGDISGAFNDKAVGQLAGIRYEHNARGQVVIESKDDLRKRGVKSPDLAEAIMLAYGESGVEPRIRLFSD